MASRTITVSLITDISDAALIEEAARRGMSVMDAAEAARLRARSEALDAVVSVHAEYFVMDREPFDDASPEPEDVWRYDRDFRAALLRCSLLTRRAPVQATRSDVPAHDAEVARAAAEKALREAAGYCTSENWTGPAATLVHLNHWLTTRADRLAGGESRG